MGQMYSVTVSAVAVTVAQDVFELNVASTKAVRIHGLIIAQYSDAADAQDELLSILIQSGYTTSGSGGSAPTPGKLGGAGLGAASSTVEANNTTVATSGTIVTHHADAFNVRAGYQYRPTPEERIELAPSSRLVARITAPADSLTLNATLIFEEIG
jgi:hypothetical protein